MGTEIKAAAIAAALGAFAGGAPGKAPVGTEQRLEQFIMSVASGAGSASLRREAAQSNHRT